MPREPSVPHPAARVPYLPRRIHTEAPRKLPELARCNGCGASYRNGRWTWEPPAEGSYERACPACERIAARHPAGVIRLEGEFARAYRDDLIRLLRNVEAWERDQHPLKRIMEVLDDGTGILVTVTDARLAHAFGRALARAYGGCLEHPPTTAGTENLVRIRWSRD